MKIHYNSNKKLNKVLKLQEYTNVEYKIKKIKIKNKIKNPKKKTFSFF
jgi:hypothetical protein